MDSRLSPKMATLSVETASSPRVHIRIHSAERKSSEASPSDFSNQRSRTTRSRKDKTFRIKTVSGSVSLARLPLMDDVKSPSHTRSVADLRSNLTPGGLPKPTLRSSKKKRTTPAYYKRTNQTSERSQEPSSRQITTTTTTPSDDDDSSDEKTNNNNKRKDLLHPSSNTNKSKQQPSRSPNKKKSMTNLVAYNVRELEKRSPRASQGDVKWNPGITGTYSRSHLPAPMKWEIERLSVSDGCGGKLKRKVEQLIANPPYESGRTIKGLADYVLSITAEQECLRAWAIVCWMTKFLTRLRPMEQSSVSSQDDAFLNASAEEVFKRRAGGSLGFARLFEVLATKAKLAAVTIPSYSRCEGWKMIGKFRRIPQGHSAIKLGSQWHLLDVFFCSRYTQDTLPCEDYFLCPAGQFIYTHLPVDSEWQLRGDFVVSMGDFMKLPQIERPFIEHGMELVSHTELIIDAQGQSIIDIELESPEGIYFQAFVVTSHGRSPGIVMAHKRTVRVRVAMPEDYTPGSLAEVAIYSCEGEDGEGDYTLSLKYGIINALPCNIPTIGLPVLKGFQNDGSSLISPLNGRLERGKIIEFMVEMPNLGSGEVFVRSGASLYYLKKNGDVFSGHIRVASSKVKLCSKNLDLTKILAVYRTYRRNMHTSEIIVD